MPKAGDYKNYFSAISSPLKSHNGLPTHPHLDKLPGLSLSGFPFAYPNPPVGTFNQIQRRFVFCGCKENFSDAFFKMKNAQEKF